MRMRAAGRPCTHARTRSQTHWEYPYNRSCSTPMYVYSTSYTPLNIFAPLIMIIDIKTGPGPTGLHKVISQKHSSAVTVNGTVPDDRYKLLGRSQIVSECQ